MSFNRFASLNESKSESDDSSVQGDELPKAQSKRMVTFQANQPKQCKNLIDLSCLVDKLVATPEGGTACFEHHFFDYEDYEESDYDTFMDQRSKCYKEFEDVEFVKEISNAVIVFEPLEIRPLIDKFINSLSNGKTACFGTLFLIGLIVSQRPDLITPEAFSFTHEKFLEVSPILSWIIYKSLQSDKITHLDPLISHQLLEIFLGTMVSKEKESDPAAICSAHLIRMAFEKQKIMRVSSKHFAHLIEISNRQSTPRDCHVAHVLLPLIEKLSTIDKKALAMQLMEVFPDAPECATDVFIKEISKKGNVTFVDGWVEAHSTHQQESIRYLNAVAGKIPEKIVCKFPKKDLRQGSNRIKLAVVQVELTNTSFRFCFIVFVALIIMYFYNRRGM